MAWDHLQGQIEVVEWTAGRLEGGRGNMEVAGRGTEIAMAQQDLNGSQVGAGLEQVGSETEAQGMHAEAFAQARSGQRLLADLLDRPRTDRLVGLASGEEVRLGSLDLPILAEDLQEPRGEHQVSIPVPLGLTDVDDHACAVDVLDL